MKKKNPTLFQLKKNILQHAAKNLKFSRSLALSDPAWLSLTKHKRRELKKNWAGAALPHFFFVLVFFVTRSSFFQDDLHCPPFLPEPGFPISFSWLVASVIPSKQARPIVVTIAPPPPPGPKKGFCL